MNGRHQLRFDTGRVQTPCYVIDLGLLRDNLAILAEVKRRTGCKILLALKCFSMFRVFPLIAATLDGVCASSPHEARLGREEFGGEVHTFAAAYSEEDIRDLCTTSDHILFNSMGQLQRLRPLIAEDSQGGGSPIELGIRINPEHSEGAVPVYDPCAPGSRLGIRRKHLAPEMLDGVTGLHWHNLCEQDADCLQRTVAAVEAGFAEIIPRMRMSTSAAATISPDPAYDLERLDPRGQRFSQQMGGAGLP
jgi:carboxynorspermidine decarboxylase